MTDGRPQPDSNDAGDRPEPGSDDAADRLPTPEENASVPREETPTAENGMLVAERETEEGLLVAVCDSELLGETFEEGKFSLTVNEEFYGGDEVDEPAVVDSLARATVANIVGTRAVELAVEEGFVEEANVLDIGATRHAQLLRMY